MGSNQIAIKEVLNVSIFNYATGAPIFYADYASNTSVETSSERLDLTGGQGNYKLVSFDHTKNAMMKCELPLVDLEFIALLTGKPINIGAVNVPQRDVLTANGSNEITLTQTPVAGTLKVYAKSNARDNGTEQTVGTPGSNVNEYSIVGTTITLNATSGAEGTEFFCTYEYSAPSTTKTMTFTADKFAQYVRIVGEGIVTDQVTGEEFITKFDFKKGKPQGSFTLSMSSQNATVLDITFDLYSVDISDGSGGIDKVYFTMHELA